MLVECFVNTKAMNYSLTFFFSLIFSHILITWFRIVIFFIMVSGMSSAQYQ